MKQWIFILVVLISSLEGGNNLPKAKRVATTCVPIYPPETHYTLGKEALDTKNWEIAVYNFNVIAQNFPNHVLYQEAKFFLGIAYFNAYELEYANSAFSNYLNGQSNPRYFEEAIGYKLKIAERFRLGAKRRCFGAKCLPKWSSGRSLAIEIYDEVIASLPCHDYAAISLYSKACMHWEAQDFKESIEAFQLLVRRFPKHELTPTAYLSINQVYLEQAENEFQNPDILALAQINLKKFQRAFPKDEKLTEAEAHVQAIKEFYARGLWETGQFYERIEKPTASAIYYARAIKEFPDTSFAQCCRYRLTKVAEMCKEIEVCDDLSSL